MKSLKPFVFVLAGMLITVALFSFKNEEPKKEYALMYWGGGYTVNFPDGTEKKISCKIGDYLPFKNKIINDLAKEGWIPFMSSDATSVHFYRIKQ